MKRKCFVMLSLLVIICLGLLAGCESTDAEAYQFKTSELEKYTIVYADNNPDYFELAMKLSDRISAKYNTTLTIMPDTVAAAGKYEILLGDTNRCDQPGKVMEYSVTVEDGKFRINVGGSFSAEKAVAFLCDKVFTGKELNLNSGEYYKKSFLTEYCAVTDGSTARIMTANILADAFADSTFNEAYYRAEIFAGMLIAYTPDVVGLQEADKNWNDVLDAYLTKIQKSYGITYARQSHTHQDKLNYTAMLYRADKLKAENSGTQVFSWWTNSTFHHDYHMRNVSWTQFSSLENENETFVVANTHWSYRTEHADGKTYLAGSNKPITADELRTQCKDETNQILTALRGQYPGVLVFLTGDFNTSLTFFTQSGWTPTSFKLLSEEAKRNGTCLTNVPTSGHFDHLFGAGEYAVNRFAFVKDKNQLGLLSDHPFVYADLTF